MLTAWLLAYLLLAAADWLAIWRGWQRAGYLTKPAVLAVLLIGFGAQGLFSGSLLWFGIGLFFSLLGDIFLLLTHSYFIFGLTAFLIAHAAYIIGFNQPLPEAGFPLYILGLVIFSGWLVLFGRLERALRASRRNARMRLPVALYSVVLAVMLFSALLTLFRPDWDFPAAICAALGGLLFFFSDTLLAFDRFVRPLKRARFWVRVTYHLGQLGLAAGALLHILK